MKRIILILFFVIIVLFLRDFIKNSSQENNYINAAKKEPNEIIKIIEKINKKSENVNSFLLSKTSISCQKNQLYLNASGDIAFEKDKNFRLIVKNIFSIKDLDVGSNDKIFWYWSRYTRSSNLFFGSHINLQKSNFKPEFSPIWMIECMGLNKIETENCEFTKTGIIQKHLDSYIVFIFDTEKECLQAKLLYNNLNVLIASVEYEDFSNNLPQAIILKWIQEKTTLKFDFKNAAYNQPISESYWTLPDIYPQKNLDR